MLEYLNNKKDEVSVFLLCLLSLFTLMPFGVLSITLISFVLWVLLFYRKNFLKNFKNIGIKPYLECTLFYLILVLSITYSYNKMEGISEIQKGLPLLVLPFIFIYFIRELLIKKIEYFLKFFVVSNLIYVFIIYNFSLFKLVPYSKFKLQDENYITQLFKILKLPFGDLATFAINTSLQPFPIFFHKGYNSMFILFSIVILCWYLYLNLKLKQYKKLLWKILSIFIFLIVLFHWLSIPNIILSFLLIVIFILFKIPKAKYLLFPLIFIFVFIYNTEYIQKLISENYTLKTNIRQVKTFINAPFDEGVESDAIRVSVYKCSFFLIKKSMLFGFGVGSTKQKLDNCYVNQSFRNAESNKLNSHNYFMHLWLAAGVSAFLAFLAFFIRGVISSIKNKNTLYLSFIIIIFFNSLTENILFRSHGVVFFAIFNSLLHLQNTKSFNKLNII